jgi:hypothetical protein
MRNAAVRIALVALALVFARSFVGHAATLSPGASLKHSPSPSNATSLIVRGYGRTGFQIGPYIVDAAHDRPLDPELTLRAAIRALGKPTCDWPGHGQTFAYVTWSHNGQELFGTYAPANFNNPHPTSSTCAMNPSDVYVVSITAAGSRWHTDRGLRIGDSVARLRALYPGANDTLNAGNWVVGTIRVQPQGFNPINEPSLEFSTTHSVVEQLTIDIWAVGP